MGLVGVGIGCRERQLGGRLGRLSMDSVDPFRCGCGSTAVFESLVSSEQPR